MSKIKSQDTKPELTVRRFLFSLGHRYRLNVKQLPGTPDIVLLKYKTVIFVHGCFWHGHKNCKKATIPKTRTEWWTNKIERNRLNDSKAKESLMNLGWKVVELWTCESEDYWKNNLLSLLKK